MFGSANETRYTSASNWTRTRMQIIQQNTKRFRIKLDYRELQINLNTCPLVSCIRYTPILIHRFMRFNSPNTLTSVWANFVLSIFWASAHTLSLGTANCVASATAFSFSLVSLSIIKTNKVIRLRWENTTRFATKNFVFPYSSSREKKTISFYRR